MTGPIATNADYTRSGYDKGHMAPAADMKWSPEAMKESFYFSNMCPQHPQLNRRGWKNLEEKIRNWAIADSAIITDQNNYIEQNSKNKVLYLELKNVGLNHAIINSYKINNEETQELIPIHTKVIVRRDQCGYLTITFSDSEFENNKLNIYYTDIFDNCYMSQFSLVGGEFKQSTSKSKYYDGKIKQTVLSEYKPERSIVNNDLN